MTVKTALKREGRCYLKDTPKGWRRAGAKSHYQHMREKRDPPGLIERIEADSSDRAGSWCLTFEAPICGRSAI